MRVGSSKGPTGFRNELGTSTAADELFADYVIAMATDQHGALWVGSFGGAAQVIALFPKP